MENTIKVRCNNCMCLFEEDDLVLLEEGEGEDVEYYKGCPNCLTDGYLMDLD